MSPEDLSLLKHHKESFRHQGFNLTVGEVIRLAIRQLNPGSVSNRALEQVGTAPPLIPPPDHSPQES